MLRRSFFSMVLTAVSCITIATICTGFLYAETVFLKDGGIIEGRIVSDAAGSVTVRDKDNKRHSIPRGRIMRILYTELYMGKVYVQKTDGKGIIAYMVDEDRESYTFRKELFSPEEFKLRRDQVLFMARGNPSGLQGEADTDRVELKWFPPYNQVKRYKIYIKENKEKKFRFADDTGSKSITLKGLKSNTKYIFYITAIDSAGDESLPSNQLAITTKNVGPSEPEIIPAEKFAGEGYRITWKESTDPDGRLAGYRVYKKLGGKKSVIAETGKREYTLSKNEKYDYIYVAAFDDLKAESGHSFVYLGRKPFIGLSLSPAYLFASGDLKDFADYGYGATVKANMTDYSFYGLELSAALSFFYLPGKGGFEEPENKVNGLYLVPFMFNAGYIFYITETVAVVPHLSAGAVYLRYDYSYYDIQTSKTVSVVDNEIDPAAGGGVTLRYGITEGAFIDFSAGYVMFFEESGSFSYISAALGAGMKF